MSYKFSLKFRLIWLKMRLHTNAASVWILLHTNRRRIINVQDKWLLSVDEAKKEGGYYKISIFLVKKILEKVGKIFLL